LDNAADGKNKRSHKDRVKSFDKLRKKQPFFNIFKGVLRIFYKKPKLINLAGELPDKYIVVSNHSTKNGPMTLELYFPKKTVKWGAHEMLGNYSTRRNYLKDIYYIKKRKMSPFFASVCASFEAAFSFFIYKGMWFIGTFTDTRVRQTLNESVACLEQNYGITIFPENSDEGYFDVVNEFHPGFVLLSSVYKKKTGEDLPVYPVHYNKRKRLLVIGNPDYVNKMLDDGLSRAEVAEVFRNKINELYYTFVEKDN